MSYCTPTPNPCHPCTCDGGFAEVCVDKLIQNSAFIHVWSMWPGDDYLRLSIDKKIERIENELRGLRTGRVVLHYYGSKPFTCSTCHGTLVEHSEAYERVKAELDAMVEKMNRGACEKAIAECEAKLAELKAGKVETIKAKRKWYQFW